MADWKHIERIDSSDTNVSKYVFTKDDAAVESVLYRYGDFNTRTVICCSTMSGCPVGCRFCGAGDVFVRSLTAEEIVSQPRYLIEERGIDPAQVERMQIMFMSMGEPLLNQRELVKAIRALHEMYPRAALLVSTSGPSVDYSEFFEVSREIAEVGLQFSVHESTDERRAALIPFANKMPLADIARVGEDWAEATGRSSFFNYCAHSGNSSDEDAGRLARLFDPGIWQATISVICERDETIADATRRQRGIVEGFESLLMNRGFRTRVFDPAGQDDIGGGCGQLWYFQQWTRENAHLTRQSSGSKEATR